MSIESGWYPAEGDPPNTVRYWNGSEWQGGPQAPPVQQAASAPNTPDPFAPRPADQISEPRTPPPSWGQMPTPSPAATPSGGGSQIEPGWYPADGDPPNTIRYWNGTEWQGGPQSADNLGSGQVDQLGPLQYFRRAYTERFANFSGRARRAEFGWFVLLSWVVLIVLSIVTGDGDVGGAVVGIFWLAGFIPYLAVSVRRLHDLNISGWALLAMIVPLVNLIFFLFLLFSDSRPAPNQWGRSPKYG